MFHLVHSRVCKFYLAVLMTPPPKKKKRGGGHSFISLSPFLFFPQATIIVSTSYKTVNQSGGRVQSYLNLQWRKNKLPHYCTRGLRPKGDCSYITWLKKCKFFKVNPNSQMLYLTQGVQLIHLISCLLLNTMQNPITFPCNVQLNRLMPLQ